MDNKYLKEYKGWIPFAISFPEINHEVLFACKNIADNTKQVFIGKYYIQKTLPNNLTIKTFDISDSQGKVDPSKWIPIAWMYLPEFPSDEDIGAIR